MATTLIRGVCWAGFWIDGRAYRKQVACLDDAIKFAKEQWPGAEVLTHKPYPETTLISRAGNETAYMIARDEHIGKGVHEF